MTQCNLLRHLWRIERICNMYFLKRKVTFICFKTKNDLPSFFTILKCIDPIFISPGVSILILLFVSTYVEAFSSVLYLFYPAPFYISLTFPSFLLFFKLFTNINRTTFVITMGTVPRRQPHFPYSSAPCISPLSFPFLHQFLQRHH